MNDQLIWTGLEASNPWWATGKVPPALDLPFKREIFHGALKELTSLGAGRGMAIVGPRRVGKSTLMFQIISELLKRGEDSRNIFCISLDDPTLKFQSLGNLLDLFEARFLHPTEEPRYLFIDEVQYAEDWSLWLKKIADRKRPYRFFVTGSAATMLRKGGQDAGLGRWWEWVLYPFSFREFVRLRGLKAWSFDRHDKTYALEQEMMPTRLSDYLEVYNKVLTEMGPIPADESNRLQGALEEYLLRGGFPELINVEDLREARRRLRQDILDRALGRDLLDMYKVDDPRALERMFLRVCHHPGGLWNESEVSKDIGVTRPTAARYLMFLEYSYLVFSIQNFAKPYKGRRKVYLVDPALRQALLGIDRTGLLDPNNWGPSLENAVLSAMNASRPPGWPIGFWLEGGRECDAVKLSGPRASFIQVKTGRKIEEDVGAAVKAAEALKAKDYMIWILSAKHPEGGFSRKQGVSYLVNHPASWLYLY